MEGVNDPTPLFQAVKTKKVPKTKSNTTSGVSQKAPVVKTTKSQPKGSDQVIKDGEGIGENQVTQKNKAGESVINQPSHVATSQSLQALIWMNTHYYPFPLKRVWILKRAQIQGHRTLGGSIQPNQ